MSKKKNFRQWTDDDYADNMQENDSWGKYKRRDGKREDGTKRRIQNARKRKMKQREDWG